jgi:hypothetical protein
VKVTVTVYHHEIFGSMLKENKYSPDTLFQIRAWIDVLLEKIPAEFRDSAKMEIDSVGGYEGEHHAEVTVTYERPETAKETEARKAEEAATREEQEARERRMYEQLRAKYQA